jgi:hypothetical protein
MAASTPRLLALAIALTLATAGLAGCIGGDDGDTSPGLDPAEGNDTDTDPSEDNRTQAAEPDPGPNVTVSWYNGTAQGQAIPGAGPTCFAPACDNVFDLSVPNGTTGLVAEMAWDRSTSLSLDLDVPPEECESTGDCPPESVSGESPLELRLIDPIEIPPGDWSIGVYAEDSPVEATEFTIAVSLFEDGSVPGDYGKLAR